METEKRLKMLQLFYAGVLADSIRNYSEAGILDIVESKKEKEQKLAAKGQLAQLNISTPSELFNTFSEIFGCISWNIEEKSEKIVVRGNFCLLCAIAKKMDMFMHMSLTASALIFQSNIERGVDIIISNLTLTVLLYVTVFIINVVTKGQITNRISLSTTKI